MESGGRLRDRARCENRRPERGCGSAPTRIRPGLVTVKRCATLRVAAWLTACLALAPLAAHAADYPNRPIRLVLPFPPGGGSDTLARILAPRMSEAMGVQWVVDNR